MNSQPPNTDLPHEAASSPHDLNNDAAISDAMPTDQFMAALRQQSAHQLVLVDFQAAWCSPCRALLPVLEKLALEYRGQLTLVTVDAEQRADLIEALAVRGLPTVLLYLHGREINRFTKALPERDIRLLLKPYINSPEKRLKQQAEQAFEQHDWSTGLEHLRALLQYPTATARDWAHFCHRLMDALPEYPQLKAELQQALQSVDAHGLRDPAMQHAISRWHLLERNVASLDVLQYNFRQQPSAETRLALAEGLASDEQYEQALTLLLGLLRRPCSDEQEAAAKALLFELINTLPDRAQANRYRREWFDYQRQRQLSEEPDQNGD